MPTSSWPRRPSPTGGLRATRDQKIKKDGSGQRRHWHFVENPDILLTVAQTERAQGGALFCVGFAAESHDLVAHAKAKRERKGIPLLVGNIGPLTFGQDDNQLLLVDAGGVQELPRAPKLVLRADWWPRSPHACPPGSRLKPEPAMGHANGDFAATWSAHGAGGAAHLAQRASMGWRRTNTRTWTHHRAGDTAARRAAAPGQQLPGDQHPLVPSLRLEFKKLESAPQQRR